MINFNLIKNAWGNKRRAKEHTKAYTLKTQQYETQAQKKDPKKLI